MEKSNAHQRRENGKINPMYTFTFNNYQLMANYQFISFSDSVFSENKARTKTSEDRPLSGEICVSVHQVGVKHRVNHKNELKIWSVTLLNGFTSLETTSVVSGSPDAPHPPSRVPNILNSHTYTLVLLQWADLSTNWQNSLVLPEF